MRPDYGPAAQGFSLPPRQLRDHSFPGPGAVAWRDEPGSEDWSRAVADMQAQLSGAITIGLDAPAGAATESAISVSVTLQNEISGHRFPTGSNFFRQVWVSVRVLDADGRLVYRCDPLDVAGSRCGSSADSLYLSARLFDAADTPTFLPWQAVRLVNNALMPLERRTIDVEVRVAADARGPLRVEASIEFRTFPLDLLRELDLSSDHAVLFQLGAASAQIVLLPAGEP
jgi:hypothetical protein